MSAVPPPSGDPQGVLQVQVTNLDYSDYLGRIAIARVFQGTLHRGELVGIAKLDGSLQTTRITKLFNFRGLERDEAETVSAGRHRGHRRRRGHPDRRNHHRSPNTPRRSSR